MDTYSQNRSFRIKILSMMLDNSWMAKYGNSIIRPEFFEQNDEETVAKGILLYRSEYGLSPTDPEDLIAICNTDGISDLAYEIYHDDYDLTLAADTAVQFAREQALKLAILESVDDISKGDLKTPSVRVEEALRVGQAIGIPGIDPYLDVDKWLYEYWEEKIPTRLTHVDKILQGGLGAGELGIILAPQNFGKSMALINIGYGAASIGSGKNVIHFTHEMSVAQTAKRYAARTLFRFPLPGDDQDDYSEDLLDAARKLITGRIRIIGGSKKMSIQDVEGHIERLDAEDFHPDVIIDDYVDLIESPRHYSERRYELSATYEWFRQLGANWGVPVWSASQANRGSFTKEFITMADIAEDIGKASIADVIISICQTKEEAALDRCRLFMAKVRDGKSKGTLSAKYYGEQQAIITTGVVVYKEKDA